MKKEKNKIVAALLTTTLAIGSFAIQPVNTIQAATTKASAIKLNSTKKTMFVGETATLKVKKVTPAKGSKAVTWKSSNKKIASVTSKGKVTAKKAGTAKITATSKVNKKVKATCTITVKTKTISPTSEPVSTVVPTSTPVSTVPVLTNAPVQSQQPNVTVTTTPTPTMLPQATEIVSGSALGGGTSISTGSSIGAENVSVKEYVVKFSDLLPKFTGETHHFDSCHDGITFGSLNVEEVEAYGKTCDVTYKIEPGDDDFIAQKSSNDSSFMSYTKPFNSFTGTSITTVDAGSDPADSLARTIECKDNRWIVVEKDRYTNPSVINGVGVILSDTASLEDGLTAFENEINNMNDNGILDGPKDVFYTVSNLSLREYANLVGECFDTKGYIVSNAGEGDILFKEASGGGTLIQSDDLKAGETLVFFSLERPVFTDRTAAIYSQILQGTYPAPVFDK